MDRNNRKKLIYVIEDFIYYIIIGLFILVILMLSIQKLSHPERIPNFFGYKTFIVLGANMTDEIQYGDLVVTHNVKKDNLKKDDIIAFRHLDDIVGVTKITNIDNDNIEVLGLDKKNTILIKGDNVEGILAKRIPKVGLIFFYMQEPAILLLAIVMVMLLGLIFYYVAQELDKIDEAEQEGQE